MTVTGVAARAMDNRRAAAAPGSLLIFFPEKIPGKRLRFIIIGSSF
jgi:hypothetical protein